MNRKCPNGKLLLPRMHYKSGRYYRVHRNHWQALPKNYNDALRRYAELESPRSGWSDLVNIAYQDYEHRLKNGDLSENTWKQYQGIKARIVYGLGDYAPHEITTSHVTQYLYQYRHTPNIANRMLSVLRVIFAVGCKTGACDFNPAHGVKREPEKKRKRYLTHAEYCAIRDHANPQTALIMDMCYFTAQRIGDVLALKHSQISPQGITFTQQKTEKRILVSMTPDIETTIRDAKALRKVMCQYLFHPKGKSTPYQYHAIRDSFRRAREAAGVAHATLHDIRAKSLTDAEAAGMDAQKLAGHTNAAMTARYIRLRKTDVVSGPGLRNLIEIDQETG